MPASGRLRGIFIASSFAVLSLALLGASCDKQSAARPPSASDGPNVPFEAPAKGAAGDKDKDKPAAKPADPPAPASPQSRFDAMADKLQSPCGKAQSLKKTLESDPGCKRGPFARTYLERLLKAELSDDEIKEIYKNRYGSAKTYQFDLKDTPFIGMPNAPITMVEFFDYGCPHCRDKRTTIENIVAARPTDVAIYYKNFPLGGPGHENSVIAAHAARAAYLQGKFAQMHEKLFSNQGHQSKDELFGYAKELGLDMKKFEADFNDPAVAARIDADKAEGERGDLEGTPTVYFNGRKFSDPITVEDATDWIDEELAASK